MANTKYIFVFVYYNVPLGDAIHIWSNALIKDHCFMLSLCLNSHVIFYITCENVRESKREMHWKHFSDSFLRE